MKFVFRGIFSASLLMFTIESFGYTKDAEVKSWLSANVVFSTGHELSMNQVKQIASTVVPAPCSHTKTFVRSLSPVRRTNSKKYEGNEGSSERP